MLDDQRENQDNQAVDPGQPPAETATPSPATDDGDATAVDDRVNELEDHLRGALADLDNLRKRFDREVRRERHAELGRSAAMWLPVVDDLERALQHADADAATIIAGVEAVREHALSVLERLGFPRFDDLGSLFDPTRDEAVSAVDANAPAGTVVATVRPGYGHDDEILRPAAVVVAKGADAGRV